MMGHQHDTRTVRPTGRDRRDGAAAVELAVLLPFILFLCAITADWARIFYMTISANACARNGALYASDQIYADVSGFTSTTEAALAEAPSLNQTPTVSQTSVTDAAGHSAVNVTVSITFNTILHLPGVPSTQTVTRSCQMRLAPVSAN